MHDIVISGGVIRVVTGALACTGDVAIRTERGVAVGGTPGPARWVIDAGGYAEDTGIRPGRLVSAGR